MTRLLLTAAALMGLTASSALSLTSPIACSVAEVCEDGACEAFEFNFEISAKENFVGYEISSPDNGTISVTRIDDVDQANGYVFVLIDQQRAANLIVISPEGRLTISDVSLTNNRSTLVQGTCTF